MKLRYKGVTDVGRRRDANEDCFAVVPEDGLFIVADGMGGHAAGEVASRLAVSAIADFIASTRRDAEITWPFEYDTTMPMEGNRLKTAIRLANQRILDTINHKKDLEGMGTTLVSAIVSDTKAWVGHVGDSRAYLVRDGVLTQITSDHSWVNEQVKLGYLSRNDATHHPFRNVVTRALGSKDDVVVDLCEQGLRAGDYMLLCSDGLNTMLDDEAIREIIMTHGGDVEAGARALIARANDNGGDDNVTVVLVKVE
jgi:serine/threonine protein phosphatase PrpC